VLQDDVANDYSSLLCAGFGAECQWAAWSGITLWVGHPNLPERYPWTLGGVSGAFPYNFSSAWGPPDVIFINLGENDCNGGACNEKHYPNITAAFVEFVGYLQKGYSAGAPGGVANITYFLAIAPHEKGQSNAILPAVAQLQAAGLPVHFANGTVTDPSLPNGCAGHPGPTIHAASAARLAPQIAAVMGW